METQSNKNAQSLNIKQTALFLITLTLMSMAGLVGSDVYLPTLPEIGKSLSQSPEAMQLTLGIYLLGLSVSQLFFGPLTDRFGRKKLLLLCMGIYFIASMACALSTNLSQLLVFRLLQAIGASAGLVIGRAIIGDLFEPKEAGKVFATIFPIVGMSPAISPAIGGFVGHYLGWQANFIFVGLFALSVLLLASMTIPESLPEKNRKQLHLFKILSTYPEILTSRKFLYYALAPCTAYVAFFAYIAQSPFIFHAHGFGERAIGLFYITLSLTYVAGGYLSKRYLKEKTIDETLNIGFKYFILGAFLFLLCNFFNVPLIFMVIFISVLTFGNGFLIPLGTAGVVSSFAGRIGFASGLLGFVQLGVAALTTSFIGEISMNQVGRLSEFIFVVVIIGSCFRWLLAPRKSIEVLS